ncbi:MAG: helix-turn-helix transcriptional regulator, partial [Acetobacteraceae bacterium]|nr:helix-turn-helix transcriptional regulator [Acetobacteraceae bacterium]
MAARQVTEGDADLATIAKLLAEPSRAAMLIALTDGRALPAGELARVAGVQASTASAHL